MNETQQGQDDMFDAVLLKIKRELGASIGVAMERLDITAAIIVCEGKNGQIMYSHSKTAGSARVIGMLDIAKDCIKKGFIG